MHPKFESDGDFNFSLEPRKFGPFSIGDHQYVLREPTEKAHIAYKNATMKGLKVTKEQGGEFTGGAEADAVLVANCLFRLTPGATAAPHVSTGGTLESVLPPAPVPLETPMSTEFVQALPRRISSRLYQKVRDLGGMDEEVETEEFLSKRIEADQKKLAALKKDGTPGKGVPSSTRTTSS